MKRLNVLAAFVLLASSFCTQATEQCLARAAEEFSIPGNVLDAIRKENKAPLNPEMAAREFGPMGLGEAAIQAARAGAGLDPGRAKSEACENYRAAAWFLADGRKRSGGDLWIAVKRYRGGRRPDFDEFVSRVKLASQSN